MSEPQSWDMLARYLANETTAEEAAEIQAWMDSDPENRLMVQKLKASFSVTVDEDASDLNALWSKIAQEVGRSKYGIARTSSRKSLFEWIRQAISARPVWVPVGAMAVLLAVAWLPYYYWKSPDLLTVEVPFGERLTVDLQDGSRVVLDAGSRLLYPEQFADDSRHVTLSGQGYFQVSPDAARPFVVTAGYGEVEVLGTAFDVQSWDDSPVVVSVAEGRVKFARVRGDGDQSVVLGADQVSTLGSAGGPTSPTTADVSRRLAWMRDEVFFDDAPLSEILDRLRRWHSVAFSVPDPTLLDERLTLHLFKSDLSGSLELITRLLNLEMSREDASVRLTRRDDAAN